jgi:hypothetical protein
VTLKTYLPARYCTLFKVWGSWLNELKGYMKYWSRSKCTGQLVPTLQYCVLFYSVFNLSLMLYQNVVIRLPSEQLYFVCKDHLKCCHPVLFYYTRLILCSK